jgi:hypothetical protein
MVMSCALSWDTFSASELAISLALLTLLLHQSLLGTQRILDSEDKKQEVAAWAYGLLGFSAFLIALFAANVVFDTQVNKLLDGDYEGQLRISQATVFLLAPFPVVAGIVAQRVFHLKAGMT